MGTLAPALHQTSLGFTDIRQLELVLQRSDLGAHTSITSLVTPLVTSLVTTAKLLLGKTTEIVNLLIFVFIVFSALKVKVGMSVFNYLLKFSNYDIDVHRRT